MPYLQFGDAKGSEKQMLFHMFMENMTWIDVQLYLVIVHLNVNTHILPPKYQHVWL